MSNVFSFLHRASWLGLFLFVASFAHAAKPTPPPAPAPPPQPTYRAPEYFYTVELDPRYQFIGTGAMTEEQAAKANCYRFIYSANGRLQSIEYRRAGVLSPDPVWGVARIDFEYQPGIERRWFHNAKGDLTKDTDDVYGEELTLNAAGVPTDVTHLDESGGRARDNNGVMHYVRTLDEHGRLVIGRRIGLFGTPVTDNAGFYETQTHYDPAGFVIERSNHDASGNLLNNDDGVALIRSTTTIYPDGKQTVEGYFDASSLAAEEKSTGVHQRQRAFDSRGFLVDEAYFDSTGAPIGSSDDGVHERRYTFDDRGNEVTEEFLDANGHPTNRKGPDYAKVVYKYDDKNRVIEKSYFGDDGTPQVVATIGAAKIRQEYNAQGDLVRRAFLDGQGHPKAQTELGVPVIRIKVDHDTTVVTLCNDNDKPIKNPVSGYYAYSYKTADGPRDKTYYDRHGREMSPLRIKIINPHLYALKTEPLMQWSARIGVGVAGLGSLLAAWLALKKSSHTKRRKIWVPSPMERFLGWFAVLAILDGALVFFLTLYWAWLSFASGRIDFLQMVGYDPRLKEQWSNYHNGPLDYGIYVLETIFLIFMLYRLYRQSCTMRVLNIAYEDIHRLVKDFLAKAGLKAEWVEERHRYITPPLDIRVNYFQQKCHAYLAFTERGNKGHEFAREAAAYIRAQAGGILGPKRTRGIALYYPIVAFAYLLLAGTAFYTLYQVIKGY